MIMVGSDLECKLLLAISFQEFCEFRVLRFGYFLEESLCSMNILGQDGCLEVDESQLQVVGHHIERLVNQVESATLLFSIVTHDEVFLVCICQLQDPRLPETPAGATSQQIVNGALGSSEHEAIV